MIRAQKKILGSLRANFALDSTIIRLARSSANIPSILSNTYCYKSFSTNNSDTFDEKLDRINPRHLNLVSSSQQPTLDKNPIFVSKHFQIDNQEIFKFLDSLQFEYRVRSTGQIVTKYCPFCPKPHKQKMDNMWTLNIKANSGAYMCFRCGSKGSWYDLKNWLIGNGKHLDLTFETPLGLQSPKKSTSNPSSGPDPSLASESVAFLRLKSLMMREFPNIVQYLTGKEKSERHLSMETLEHYRVGIGYEAFTNEDGEIKEIPCVYFPMFAPKSDKNIIKAKKIMKNGVIEELKEETDSQVEQESSSNTFQNDPFNENNLIMSLINNEFTEGSSKQEIKIDSKTEEKEKEISISDAHYVLVRNKIRAIYKENKGFQKMEPAPGFWGLFGLNTVPQKAKVLVITEGEYDAMAVYEATKLPTISLPNGANHLPLQVLPWLEKFERIYLWMDADIVGQSNSVNFAQKLGVNRVFLVNTKRYDPNGPKDANDALRSDPSSIEKYILEAKPLTQENITNFSEMKNIILNRILKFEENMGLQSDYFSWFNKKVKGFRKGEMTIVTGGTGSGKTSLLSQLSLDFAKQGIGTLWGSFEVRNDILMTNMLLQFSGANLYKEPQKFDFHAQNFEQLPIYLLKYFGSHEIDKILSSIEYAIYAYDIGHVIIDNLQFLLSGQGRGFERFDIQDDAISKLRDMATTKNVHVTLVIHPKKVDDNQDLTINSVFGSAKATQEADNIFILQSRPKYRIIEIKKNRFDGEMGRIPLGFDRTSKRFFELEESELFDLHRTQITLKDVIDRRRERNDTPALKESDHSEIKLKLTEDKKQNIQSLLPEIEESDTNNATNDLNRISKEKNTQTEFKESILDELRHDDNLQRKKEQAYEDLLKVENTEEELERNFEYNLDPESYKQILKSNLLEVQKSNETKQVVNSNPKTNEENKKTEKIENKIKNDAEKEKEEKEPQVKEINEQNSLKATENQGVKDGADTGKKNKKSIYQNLYNKLNSDSQVKKTFYTDEDKESIRDNLAQYEKDNYKKRKSKDGRKSIEEELDGANKNQKSNGDLELFRYSSCSTLKLTYVESSSEAYNEIEVKLKELIDSIRDCQNKGVFNFSIDFFEKKQEKNYLFNREVRASIEKWVLTFEISEMNYSETPLKKKTIEKTEEDLQGALIKILELASTHSERFNFKQTKEIKIVTSFEITIETPISSKPSGFLSMLGLKN